MFTKNQSNAKRLGRVRRVRAKISGTAERPRLSVYRSLTHISVQLIDDVAQKTLAAASDKGLTGTRVEKAKAVGKKIAELAQAKKITTVVFDRAGFRYHGRVAAVAEGARENGLNF